MQLRSTIIASFSRISNGVAMFKSFSGGPIPPKNLLFFTFSVFLHGESRAGGVVTSREKNTGRRREGNYLKVSLGSHPLCDEGRSRSADWKSPRTREHASCSSSSPSISSSASSLARHSETRHCERASPRQAFLRRDADRIVSILLGRTVTTLLIFNHMCCQLFFCG